MGLSMELQQEIKRLDEHRDEFPYRGKGLGEKAAMLLVGGIGAGKSTIIKEMTTVGRVQGLDIQEVGTVTTRGRKPGESGDPMQYRTADEGITHELMIEKIKNGEMINWSWIEKTGHIYGCDDQSFDADVTLVPTLPDSVPQIAQAGENVHIAYVMPDANDWYEHFKDEAGNPAFRDRLEEAEKSLVFGMTDDTYDKMIRVVNHHDPHMLRELARNLLRICQTPLKDYNKYSVDTPLREGFDAQGSQMYQRIREMIDEGEES